MKPYVLALGLAFVVAACAVAEAPVGSPSQSPEIGSLSQSPETASSLRGEAIVERNCSMCHAVGRVGDSPNPQAPRFRELGQRYDVDLLAESLAEGIRTHPAMPEFTFEEDQVDDIVAYLRSIQVRQVASAPTRRIER